MFGALKTLWQAAKGYRWSLYFIRRGEGLRYALHENAVVGLLGYVLAPIENGKVISKDWELQINFNPAHRAIRLDESYFSGGQIAPGLLEQIRGIDPDFMVQVGKPVFMDAVTRDVLPLGWTYDATFQSPEQRRKSTTEMLQGKFASGAVEQQSLEELMRQIFIESDGGSHDKPIRLPRGKERAAFDARRPGAWFVNPADGRVLKKK